MSIANGQNQRDSDNQSRRLGIPEEKSGGVGNQQDKTFDLNSARSDTDEQSSARRRRKVIGGMLSQLMKDAEDQLAYSKNQISYYQKQVDSLEKKVKTIKNMKDVLFDE